MPSTPNFAIPYPCSGDNIDCGVFEDFTTAVQNALLSVDVSVEEANNRPAASISMSASQNINVGAATNVQFGSELYDNDNMANLGVNNDRLTVVTTGMYMVTGFTLGNGGSVTTLTSEAVALSRNGTILYRKKNSSDDNRSMGNTVTGLINCTAGDILRLVYLWTGTGGPMSLGFGTLSARLVAIP